MDYHQRNHIRRKRLEVSVYVHHHNNHDTFCINQHTNIHFVSRRMITIVTIVIGMICKLKLLPVVVLIVFYIPIIIPVQCQQQQDPMSLNGGSIIAMTGKDCIAIAVDKRFGIGNRLINNNIPRSILLLPNPIDITSTTTVNSDNDSHSILTTTTTEENDENNDNYFNDNNNNIIITSPQNVLLGFTGLDGDIQSLMIDIYSQVQNQLSLVSSSGNGYNGNNGDIAGSGLNYNGLHIITPKSISSLTSHILYNRKQSPYYVEPIIVGFQHKQDSTYDDDTITYDDDDDDDDDDDADADIIDTESNEVPSTTSTAFTTRLNQVWGSTTKKKQQQLQQLQQLQKTKLQEQLQKQLQKQYNTNYYPYLCSMDCIGAISYSTSFVCIGTASNVLYGIAESLWKPNMIPNELLTTIIQTFQYAIQRNSLSGSGPISIYMYHINGTIVEYTINNRYD